MTLLIIQFMNPLMILSGEKQVQHKELHTVLSVYMDNCQLLDLFFVVKSRILKCAL